MISVTIYLFRHGQTNDNVDVKSTIYDLEGNFFPSRGKVLSGHNNVSLTARGVAEAFNSGVKTRSEKLIDFENMRWIVSPQRRARQTLAAFLAGAEFVPNASSVSIDERLRERSAGALEGLTWSQGAEIWPEMLKGKEASVFHNVDAAYPEGESLRDVYIRARRCVAPFVASNEDVFLCCHELTIKAILSMLCCGLLTDDAFKEKVANATLIALHGNVFGDFTVN